MNGLSVVATQMAVQLIAAGGVYVNRPLTEVVETVMTEMIALDEWFAEGCGDPGCPDCGSGGDGGESVH